MQPKRNIAARAAHWSAAHRKIAIFGWPRLVVAAAVIGKAAGTAHLGRPRYRRLELDGRDGRNRH